VWIKREPVSLFGISSKPEKRQRIKNKKKRLSLILYSEMVKKSSGSVSEGDHQQRNNMVSFSIRIIHMSIIGLLLISCFLNTCNELLRKNVRSDFFRYREWPTEKRKNLIKPV
jgi:hypothetical protein